MNWVPYNEHDELKRAVRDLTLLVTALSDIRTYAKERYREGDIGYQFFIVADTALSTLHGQDDIVDDDSVGERYRNKDADFVLEPTDRDGPWNE